MNPVPKSTSIAGVLHDPAANHLDVKFERSGKTYRYRGVTADHYNALVNSDAPGSHFRKHIQNNFDCRCLDD